MRLHNIGEVNDFLETVDRCEGDVWLESGEMLELYCSLPEDEAKFMYLFSEHPNIV